MKEFAKFITIISAIGHFLVTFCKVGRETGEEVGRRVFEDAIVETDSQDTMLVLQTGKTKRFLRNCTQSVHRIFIHFQSVISVNTAFRLISL